MNGDCDTSSSMADAPVAPMEVAGRNLIPVPGDHEASIDICVENMEPSSGATEITGRKKYLLGKCPLRHHSL